MKRLKLFLMLLVLIFPLFLLGCWDQDQLKQARLVYTIALDQASGGQLLGSFVVRNTTSHTQQIETNNTIYYAKGRSMREMSQAVSASLNGRLRVFKFRVLLLSEKLARTQDLYPLLDSFYREPKSPLNAKVGIVKGEANEVVQHQKIGTTLIGEYLDQLIEGEEKLSVISPQDIQSICPLMFDPGEDFSLPYFEVKGNEVEVVGAAMMRGQRMVGSLSRVESKLLQMMRGKNDGTALVSLAIPMTNVHSAVNRVSFEIMKSSPEIELRVRRNHLDVYYKLGLKINVKEYPPANLDSPKEVSKLNRYIEKILKDRCKHLFAKMQKHQFDGLGIGRQIIAYHNDEWKHMNYKEVYTHANFYPTIHVESKGNGIIY